VPEFPINAKRLDPYENFKFRIVWDGRTVAGVSKMSALKRSTATVTLRADGDPSTLRRMPGQSNHEPITLERGVTQDIEFVTWASRIWEHTNSTQSEVSLEDFRKDIVIELYNEAGQRVLAYNVHKCWPSEFTALPELDGMGNATAIQSIVLQNEGWERDESVPQPKAP
jgi:phage tail-like protein